LIVLMILGVTAVVTANSQLKMAGNLQFENIAKNRAENQMAEAEAFLVANGGSVLAAGFTTWASGTKALHPKGHFATLGIANNDPLNMSSSEWLDNATGVEGYMIELLATNEPGYGANAATGRAGNCTGDHVNLFRVTSRGVGGRGAVRFVQSIHEVVSC
jgi:Tfp pilus assembly protein PilX